MNNLRDKIITIVVLTLLWGCNFNALSTSDFEKNFSTIEHLRDVVVENNLLNEQQRSVSVEHLKGYTNKEELETLTDLGLKEIENIQDVVVFSFVRPYKTSSVERTIDNKLDQKSYKECKYILFYNNSTSLRHNVAHYAQYAECQKEFIEIKKDWTYVSKCEPCYD